MTIEFSRRDHRTEHYKNCECALCRAWFYNGPEKDYHWYYCLRVAAENSQIEMVQDILMSGRDGRTLVWC